LIEFLVPVDRSLEKVVMKIVFSLQLNVVQMSQVAFQLFATMITTNLQFRRIIVDDLLSRWSSLEKSDWKIRRCYIVRLRVGRLMLTDGRSRHVDSSHCFNFIEVNLFIENLRRF
jgi:hypothetical protein